MKKWPEGGQDAQMETWGGAQRCHPAAEVQGEAEAMGEVGGRRAATRSRRTPESDSLTVSESFPRCTETKTGYHRRHFMGIIYVRMVRPKQETPLSETAWTRRQGRTASQRDTARGSEHTRQTQHAHYVPVSKVLPEHGLIPPPHSPTTQGHLPHPGVLMISPLFLFEQFHLFICEREKASVNTGGAEAEGETVSPGTPRSVQSPTQGSTPRP